MKFWHWLMWRTSKKKKGKKKKGKIISLPLEPLIWGNIFRYQYMYEYMHYNKKLNVCVLFRRAMQRRTTWTGRPRWWWWYWSSSSSSSLSSSSCWHVGVSEAGQSLRPSIINIIYDSLAVIHVMILLKLFWAVKGG